MSEYVRMPKADYVAACNSIRAKTGKSDMITSGAMSAEIDSITGSGGTSGDERVKYVTFMYGATELYKQPVISGDTCKDPLANGYIDPAIKESTAQYDYTQNGWSMTDGGSASSSALANVTEDRTVYAAFSATVRKYTATLYDEDGTTLLYTEQVAYGGRPTYKPTKEGLTFGGWVPDTSVTGDTSYTATWVSVVASGTWGTDGTWTIYGGGELRISGTGDIPNYDNYNSSTTKMAPWMSNQSSITSVVVDEGITRIGNYCFYKINSLLTVDIPATVSSFGSGVFQQCTKLTSITVPNGVTEIPYRFAYGCTNLETVYLPESIVLIGSETFQQCKKLNNINLPNSITSIGDRAFTTCSSLTSITIPTGITKLGNFVFAETVITSVVIPSGITFIHMRAFMGCNSLTSAAFENTNGWIKNNSETSTEGDAVDVSNSATAAALLASATYYLHRT